MQRGFSLIEVLISLFIISAVILSLLNQQLHSYTLSHHMLTQWRQLTYTIDLSEQSLIQAKLGFSKRAYLERR